MSLHELKALIVDDNASDRLVVKAILNQLRLETVHEAEDGTIAENKLLVATDMREPYDVIVLDWNMPRTGGMKLLQIVRANSKLKNVKVIIMTGSSNREVVEEAMKSGVRDFIVKPVQAPLLKQKLEALFEKDQA